MAEQAEEMATSAMAHLLSSALTFLPINPQLSQFYFSKFHIEALKQNIEIPSEVRERFCVCCCTPFLPGVNCVVRTYRSVTALQKEFAASSSPSSSASSAAGFSSSRKARIRLAPVFHSRQQKDTGKVIIYQNKDAINKVKAIKQQAAAGKSVISIRARRRMIKKLLDVPETVKTFIHCNTCQRTTVITTPVFTQKQKEKIEKQDQRLQEQKESGWTPGQSARSTLVKLHRQSQKESSSPFDKKPEEIVSPSSLPKPLPQGPNKGGAAASLPLPLPVFKTKEKMDNDLASFLKSVGVNVQEDKKPQQQQKKPQQQPKKKEKKQKQSLSGMVFSKPEDYRDNKDNKDE